jgi:hypothetical protein
MTKNFFLPRSRAAAAVLTMILLGACSDSVREPTAPAKALPPIPSTGTARDYSFQDGSQITVYDDEGGWSRLDVVAHTLTSSNGFFAPLTDEQTIAFLNDYQGTLTFDNLANAIQGLPSCETSCIQPTSAGTLPLGTTSASTGAKLKLEIVEKTPSKTRKDDRFGVQVLDIDKTFKEMSKAEKKSGGATILQWPPDCRVALDVVRTAKDEYAANRHSVARSVNEIFRGVFSWNPVVFAQRVVERMPELADKFFFKSLSQTNLSVSSALYVGICAGSIPVGTAGYGWYPGAVLECENVRGRASFDGGINWFWATIRICSYRSAQ